MSRGAGDNARWAGDNLEGLETSWEVFGTSAVLRLAGPREPGLLAHARAVVERELAAIDLACSRFRADSELSRVNAARGRATAVGPLLVQALQLALRAAALTDGRVDPTLGEALVLAGYDRDWRLLDHSWAQTHATRALRAPMIRARRRAGWQTVELDPERGVVRVPAGISLDLGASAKAWAADRAARAAHAACGRGVLISLGGDIATAGAAPAGGWRVFVTDDHRAAPGAPGQTISISSGGLATSSTAVRRWRHAGREMHHIIDPATRAPLVGEWRTATVAAADCADANIASTAALLRSASAAPWLQQLGLPARLVSHDGHALALGGWPAQAVAR